jgi:hypothetical protein
MQNIFLILGNAGDYSKGTEIKKIQEWIGKAGKIISVTSNRASIINDIHHR